MIGSLHARHRAIEFKKFLQTLDREVPAELDVHLILDNASTHKTPAIQQWLPPTPGSSCTSPRPARSWLNLVERWFAELTNKKLRRGTHRSVRELNTDIRAWIETWNENPRPSSGPRPPTRSSTRSPATAHELTNHDTRRQLSEEVWALLERASAAHLEHEQALQRRDELAVRAAELGAPWREVGAACGMSAQAAHERFTRPTGRRE